MTLSNAAGQFESTATPVARLRIAAGHDFRSPDSPASPWIGLGCEGSRVAVIAAQQAVRTELQRACELVGASAVTVATHSDLAKAGGSGGVGLALVSMVDLVWSPRALLAGLHERRVPRTVLVGPSFATAAHLMALEIGFDEVWPSETPMPVLAALIRAQVRRQHHSASPARATLAERLDLVVDLSGSTCRHGARFIALNQSQLETLDLLLQRAPDVVSREDIAELIPEVRSGRRVESRVVDVHVSRLRRSLRDQGVGTEILCSRGLGYRIVGARTTFSES